MTRILICFAIAVIYISPQVFAQIKSMKIAIIKADDVKKITPEWNRFFTLSEEKGVKVSAGIICNTLDGDKKKYFDWLRELNASGEVEFWNHGWDHKRWITEEKEKISEFSGTRYEYQKKHFEDSQNIIKNVLGTESIAFGAPYNKVDSVAKRVMNEDNNMRLFFTYHLIELDNKVMAPMNLRGEHDGTGKPNFEKFKSAYLKKNDILFSAIQFHPNNFEEEHFAEYAKILDFLKNEGWTFMLPAEYVSVIEQLGKTE